MCNPIRPEALVAQFVPMYLNVIVGWQQLEGVGESSLITGGDFV
jgi:hypothetical protein